MQTDLDLDSPLPEDSAIQHRHKAFSAVEFVLQSAARHLVGPSYEDLVQAELIGACAIGTFSVHDSVDVLCKASQVSGRDLFQVVKQLLVSNSACRCVRDHPEAFTGSTLSGLRFTYDQVPFRIYFAKVPWEENDEETFYSLNGCLLTRSFHELIPNANSFTLALRMVKLWAKRRGIYGNDCGYPGGLSWSICLARVCQTYPTVNAAELVARFFRMYYRWDWRTVVSLLPAAGADPVMYEPVEEGKIAVMTPGSSPVNTAANVKKMALPILQEEIRRAYKLCKLVDKGKACWSDLYAPPSIANKHKHYIRLEFVAQTEEALELLVEWGEVCLPTLLDKFETDLPNVKVRVWSQHIASPHESYAFACNLFMGLHFAQKEAGAQQQVDLRIPMVGFLEMLDKWPYKEPFAGQYDITLQHLRRAELQQWWVDSINEGSSIQNRAAVQSDESDDFTPRASRESAQLNAWRWSDSVDEYTNMCVECQ